MKIQKSMGAAVMSLGLVVGLAGFAGASTISDTGNDSYNRATTTTDHRVEIENDNELEVENENVQKAESGEAEVKDNRTGGDAETGSASNANDFTAVVEVDNSASAGDWNAPVATASEAEAVVENTGNDSRNWAVVENTHKVEVENTNELKVENDNYQHAESGDATVKDNRTGGSATTGDVMNTNSTSVTFRVTN